VLLLPWLDRSTTRSFASRGKVLWPTFIVVVCIVALSFYAQISIQGQIAALGIQPQTEDQILAAPAEAATTTTAAAGGAGGAAAGAPAGNGAQVFSQNCTSCHGANGQGSPGLAPPLAGNPFVTGDPKAVINVVSNGLHGQTIMGQSYGAQMPAWKNTLSKSDLAAVITYIRGSLGPNKASPVKESDIP
jgi:mono/diheme cytochrome c family protein